MVEWKLYMYYFFRCSLISIFLFRLSVIVCFSYWVAVFKVHCRNVVHSLNHLFHILYLMFLLSTTVCSAFNNMTWYPTLIGFSKVQFFFVCNSETHDTIFFLGRVKLQCKKYRMLARQWYRLVVIISLFLAARRKLPVSMTMVKHMYKFSVYLIWKEKHSR